MTKEFKIFNERYKSLAGTALKYINSDVSPLTAHDLEVQKMYIASIKEWKYIDSFDESYDNQTIKWAVYNSPSSEEWQQFRVRLKGLSTREKLYCLEWWFKRVADRTSTEARLDRIRVNNYLGALKRGGLLDSALRLTKKG